MTEFFLPFSASDVISAETDELSLTFFEDADYEFVGGGNAVNGF